jgi:hypothetical protein
VLHLPRRSPRRRFIDGTPCRRALGVDSHQRLQCEFDQVRTTSLSIGIIPHLACVAVPSECASPTQSAAFLYERTRFSGMTAVAPVAMLTDMDDDEILAQLRADIFEVFPPGPQRDVWLAWLAKLVADTMRGSAMASPVVH